MRDIGCVVFHCMCRPCVPRPISSNPNPLLPLLHQPPGGARSLARLSLAPTRASVRTAARPRPCTGLCSAPGAPLAPGAGSTTRTSWRASLSGTIAPSTMCVGVGVFFVCFVCLLVCLFLVRVWVCVCVCVCARARVRVCVCLCGAFEGCLGV